jgi:hypothetical protein
MAARVAALPVCNSRKGGVDGRNKSGYDEQRCINSTENRFI